MARRDSEAGAADVDGGRQGGSQTERDLCPPAAVQRRIESLVATLGPRDRRAVVVIVKRVADVADREGQAAALALIGKIIDIVKDRDGEH